MIWPLTFLFDNGTVGSGAFPNGQKSCGCKSVFKVVSQRTTNSSTASGLDCRVLVSHRILCSSIRHTANTLFLLDIPHLGPPCFKNSCRLHVVPEENPASDQKTIQPPEDTSATSRWRNWLTATHERQRKRTTQPHTHDHGSTLSAHLGAGVEVSLQFKSRLCSLDFDKIKRCWSK